MPSLRKIAVGLAAFALAGPGAASFAQDNASPSGGGVARSVGTPGGMNYVMVLMSPTVQTELKLTDDQKTRVFDLARESQQKGRERIQSLLQSGGNNPQAFLAAGLQIRQENEAAAARILTPEQKDRAEQIMLQIEGPLAVVRPEVAARLNLTQKQNQQVQMTMIQMGQAVRQMLIAQAQAQGGGAGFTAFGAAALPREALNRVRNAAVQQLSRVLDAKQKSQFNKMLGEPFDLARIDPEFASPAASTEAAPARAEKSRTRRKGSAASKGSTPRPAADDETPKP